jgi:hypothetical protein
MAKDKNKAKKQNNVKAKQPLAVTISSEEMQHLIARAIVEADEIKEQGRRRQQEAELVEWRRAIGHKEYSNKCGLWRRLRTFINRLWCILRICFVPAAEIKGDRSSFALMKLFLRIFFDFTKWVLLVVSLVFLGYGTYMFFAQVITVTIALSNVTTLFLGIAIFLLSRLFRMASIEVEKIEDRNYLFGLFASVASIVSIVIAIIAVVKGG